MRTITDHIVEGDLVNHQLVIEVIDEPGQGGASHCYAISGFDYTSMRTSPLHNSWDSDTIVFQNGPIKEGGVNGITHEALLAIIIDRLLCFQAGPFASIHNDIALTHCINALESLQQRTRERIARGVEGTHQH